MSCVRRVNRLTLRTANLKPKTASTIGFSPNFSSAVSWGRDGRKLSEKLGNYTHASKSLSCNTEPVDSKLPVFHCLFAFIDGRLTKASLGKRRASRKKLP